MGKILLTIAIPTYKRANLLDVCLQHVLSQITDDRKESIEILVSDNDSPDNTSEIVKKHIDNGFPVTYYKNNENIGPDRNFASCFLKAKGKYVWLFSDDDFILPDCLGKIFNLLGKEDFGNVFISMTSYTGEYKQLSPLPEVIDYTVFQDPIKFVEKINYWSTFISGNIVNKSLFSDYNYINEFCDSNLVQLSWVLPIIFAGKPNVFVNNQMIACLADNTGGYKLYEVFAKNYNWILDQFISKKLIDKRAKRIINNGLLKSFFPMFLRTKMLQTDGALKIMIPIYWSYPTFWVKIFPTLLTKQIKNSNG